MHERRSTAKSHIPGLHCALGWRPLRTARQILALVRPNLGSTCMMKSHSLCAYKLLEPATLASADRQSAYSGVEAQSYVHSPVSASLLGSSQWANAVRRPGSPLPFHQPLAIADRQSTVPHMARSGLTLIHTFLSCTPPGRDHPRLAPKSTFTFLLGRVLQRSRTLLYLQSCSFVLR